MKIDFVSDIACPWCAVGLNALETALKTIGDDIPVTLYMQPFELNPDMAAEGVDTGEYLAKKYGMTPEQLQGARDTLRERGAAVGFAFGERGRIWNTFHAHRLLLWAADQDALTGKSQQRALKHALLRAYHGEGLNPADPDVLMQLVREVGLDPIGAEQVIHSPMYTNEVRQAEQFWHDNGINAVPAIIINDRHLLQGGLPADVFENAIRRIAADTAEVAYTGRSK
ncbi:MAG: DsbA family oxidoreductase [Rhodocyclaceae bacterium]|nr:DsbA family oxidoreductase [Rhodocyclaceae bacterium]